MTVAIDPQAWLAQCRAYCKAIKYLGETLEWAERPNHSGTIVARSLLLDVGRVAIPRLRFEGEYQPASFGDVFRCKVMHSDHGQTLRVFMVEVYPQHKVSHRGRSEVICGPHLHLGDERVGEAVVRAVKSGLDVTLLAAWMERFRRHARIMDDQEATLVPPFAGSLF